MTAEQRRIAERVPPYKGYRAPMGRRTARKIRSALDAIDWQQQKRSDVKSDGMCIGLTANPSGPYTHSDHELHRQLSDEINESLFYSFGLHGFYWSTFQVNKNTVATPHKDKSNIGPSAIALIGDFEGGELFVDCTLLVSVGVSLTHGRSVYSAHDDGHDEHYSLA